VSRRKTANSKEKNRTAEDFSRAIEALRRSEVVVFPTETFYGLGGDAFDAVAVERVVLLKGRDPENPIPLIIADEEMLGTVVKDLPPMAKALMDSFWPGPLTLVLPAKSGLPAPLLNRNGGVGIRISSNPLAVRLSRDLGRPLTATSANPSGKEPAKSVAEAEAYFSGKVDVFLDGGKLEGKKGSTVVEIYQDVFQVLREGEIGSRELERFSRRGHTATV
jgi:L-threonylcarbamoyladenylate synthase